MGKGIRVRISLMSYYTIKVVEMYSFFCVFIARCLLFYTKFNFASSPSFSFMTEGFSPLQLDLIGRIK